MIQFSRHRFVQAVVIGLVERLRGGSTDPDWIHISLDGSASSGIQRFTRWRVSQSKSSASLAVAAGVSPHIAQKQLGHARIETTTRHYLHLPMKELLRQIGAVFD